MPAASSDNARSFKFSSGGAYHPQGFGEWHVTLDAEGALSLFHTIQDQDTDYGTRHLAEAAAAEVWRLLRAALDGLESSTRMGIPGEAQYTLDLRDEPSSRTIRLWLGDARQNAPVMALVERFGQLIQAHTEKTPILR